MYVCRKELKIYKQINNYIIKIKGTPVLACIRVYFLVSVFNSDPFKRPQQGTLHGFQSPNNTQFVVLNKIGLKHCTSSVRSTVFGIKFRMMVSHLDISDGISLHLIDNYGILTPITISAKKLAGGHKVWSFFQAIFILFCDVPLTLSWRFAKSQFIHYLCKILARIKTTRFGSEPS